MKIIIYLKKRSSYILLPIFSKTFERVIYNSIFNYFLSNKLLTFSQSGLLSRDSCISQLLSRIYKTLTKFVWCLGLFFVFIRKLS